MAFARARLLYSFGIKSVFCHARTANWILKDVKCVAYLRFNLPTTLEFGKQFVTTSIFSNYNQQTQHELEKEWIEKFRETDIPDPEYSVKWISEHIERMLTSKMLQNADTVQKNYFEAEFIRLCKRRLKREPVQYVVGDWDFRLLNLKMKAPVFIPRPEIEGLVELINQHVKLKFASSLCNILEIGCGTGAISLSLAYENAMSRCTAIDISQDAVTLARENCTRLGLCSRVNIQLCEVASLNDVCNGDKFDIIVSNPPYIPTKDMLNLQPEISRFEDSRALHGGETGLDVVNEILKVAKDVLQPEGTIWLEVDSDHPPLIKKIVETEFENELRYIQTHLDIYERPRFCQLKYLPT